MIAGLRVRFNDLAERIDALSLRERGMMFVGVMGAMYFIAMNLVFAPLRAEHKRIETALRAKQHEVQVLNGQVQTLLGAPDKSGDARHRGRVAELEQELRALDQRLDKLAGGMVSPQQMAKLLEQVLGRSRGVQLVKMENLPKTLAMGETVSASSTALGAVVYKHGVRIQLRGSYFDLIEYLRALEAMPWKVSWGEVSLESEEYPMSKITLVVYTLSRHSGWIGV